MCLLDANVSPKMCCHLKQQEILCILMQVDIRRCIRSLLEFNLTPTMCALLLYNVNIHILSEKIFSSQIVITTMRHKHLIFGKLDKNYISQIAAQHFKKHLCFFQENKIFSIQQSF